MTQPTPSSSRAPGATRPGSRDGRGDGGRGDMVTGAEGSTVAATDGTAGTGGTAGSVVGGTDGPVGVSAPAPLAPPVSPADFASAVTAITSAFGDPTRREIYLFVHGDDEGVTASAVAERFELHANVARHHLDKLVSGGYLVVDVARPPGGGAGRPSKRYRVARSEVAFELPLRHDDVLVTLLGRALAELGPERAERLAEDVGVSYGHELATSMTPGSERHRSFQAALHAVADALTAHGFAAHAERHGDNLRIVSRNCPFGEAAIEHPVICAVDRGMVRGMLDALYGQGLVAETELTLPMGGEHCVTNVQGD